MRRQNLVSQLSRLPRKAQLSVLIGDQIVGISGVVAVGDVFALQCRPEDLRDVLAGEWGIEENRAHEIAFSQPDDLQESDPTD